MSDARSFKDIFYMLYYMQMPSAQNTAYPVVDDTSDLKTDNIPKQRFNKKIMQRAHEIRRTQKCAWGIALKIAIAEA